MEILAIAGGAPGGGENLLCCCGIFPLLPLVLWLAGVAVARHSVRAAAFSLLLTGLPFLLLLGEVAGYKPTDDWEWAEEQAAGRRALAFYGCQVGIAGLSMLWVAGRHLVRWGGKHAGPPGSSSPPAWGGPDV